MVLASTRERILDAAAQVMSSRGLAATTTKEIARAAGAEIITEPHDTDYGSRDFAARDPEGNRWSFGTYRGEPRKG